jgi:hypothetical protein
MYRIKKLMATLTVTTVATGGLIGLEAPAQAATAPSAVVTTAQSQQTLNRAPNVRSAVGLQTRTTDQRLRPRRWWRQRCRQMFRRHRHVRFHRARFHRFRHARFHRARFHRFRHARFHRARFHRARFQHMRSPRTRFHRARSQHMRSPRMRFQRTRSQHMRSPRMRSQHMRSSHMRSQHMRSH